MECSGEGTVYAGDEIGTTIKLKERIERFVSWGYFMPWWR